MVVATAAAIATTLVLALALPGVAWAQPVEDPITVMLDRLRADPRSWHHPASAMFLAGFQVHAMCRRGLTPAEASSRRRVQRRLEAPGRLPVEAARALAARSEEDMMETGHARACAEAAERVRRTRELLAIRVPR